MAQLAERLLPMSEDLGLNIVNANIFLAREKTRK